MATKDELISAKFSAVDRDALHEFRDDRDLNQSEALRKATQRGLREYGYGDDADLEDETDDYLTAVVDEVTRLLAYAAATLIGVHLTTDLHVADYIVFLLVFALVAQAVVRAKPRLSEVVDG